MDDNTEAIARDCKPTSSASYAFSGKVMLISVVLLVAVCLLILCFHMYARCYLRRSRNLPHLRRRRIRRSHNFDPTTTTTTTTVASQGLDSSVLKSLPTFFYASTSRHKPLECAVCLSEFEENETACMLPKCNHCFHFECIHMWFHSHSNCPLCRAPVVELVERPSQSTENRVETVVTVAELDVSEGDPSYGFCPACQTRRDDYQMDRSSCSSCYCPGGGADDRRKATESGGWVDV